MLLYDSSVYSLHRNIFRCKGSVFPACMCIALPSALIAAALQAAFPGGTFSLFGEDPGILTEPQAWAGFTFLVGFLIVFRTSQAYNRWWDGVTAAHYMQAEWYEACSATIAFCKCSEASAARTTNFKSLLVRLVSMLHATALADIEMGGAKTEAWGSALTHRYVLLDAESVDPQSLETLMQSDAKVELVFQWIQQLLVESIDTGVLSIAPPLLTRAFQELAAGMSHYRKAMTLATTPFPFAYAQTCDCLLVLHWLIVPAITSQWVTSSLWAAVFTYIQVFIVWSLNMIATEIENPFGHDANDVDGTRMQTDMNRYLEMLLLQTTDSTPTLVGEAMAYEQSDAAMGMMKTQRVPRSLNTWLGALHRTGTGSSAGEERMGRQSSSGSSAEDTQSYSRVPSPHNSRGSPGAGVIDPGKEEQRSAASSSPPLRDESQGGGDPPRGAAAGTILPCVDTLQWHSDPPVELTHPAFRLNSPRRPSLGSGISAAVVMPRIPPAEAEAACEEDVARETRQDGPAAVHRANAADSAEAAREREQRTGQDGGRREDHSDARLGVRL